jgi:Pyruvate/2-oxoacid:ferredoxin oxidoreductase delta subunit
MKKSFVGFQILTAVATLWDVALCSPMWTDISEERGGRWRNFRFENQTTKQTACSTCLSTCYEGGATFFRNVGSHTEYTVLYHRIFHYRHHNHRTTDRTGSPHTTKYIVEEKQNNQGTTTNPNNETTIIVRKSQSDNQATYSRASHEANDSITASTPTINDHTVQRNRITITSSGYF